MIVIVAGKGRKSGKTTAVCDIIAATNELHWTAVKITSHPHGAEIRGPVVIEDHEPNAGTDTGRYVAAGAYRGVWVRCSRADIARTMAPFIHGNVIIESNSAAGVLPADLIVFIDTLDGEAKASAETVSSIAHIQIDRVNEFVIERVRALISS